jgi:CheY-like chemotaxis protein
MRTLKKILHVDDDHDIREITHVSLAQIGGFDVAQCSSVAEAVVKVAEFLPDLLLLDMRLPDGSGISILEELRKNEHFASIMMKASRELGATEILGLVPAVWSRWISRLCLNAEPAGPKMNIDGTNTQVALMHLSSNLH